MRVYRLPQGLVAISYVQPDQITPVSHDGAEIPIPEVKYPFHDVLLHLLNLPFGGTFLDDCFDLFFRDLVLPGLVQPQQFHHARRAGGEQPHERGGHAGKHVHGGGNKFCHSLGSHHADSFGDEFPENQREVGHDDHDKRFGYE